MGHYLVSHCLRIFQVTNQIVPTIYRIRQEVPAIQDTSSQQLLAVLLHLVHSRSDYIGAATGKTESGFCCLI